MVQLQSIKENQPKLHSYLITKVSSNSHPKGSYEFLQSALNYNNVLEELNNLEFILVDGFFYPILRLNSPIVTVLKHVCKYRFHI